jgi:hypothetical protein
MGNLDTVWADPTLEAMRRAIEEREAAIPPRNYLGASSLGAPCERQVWYQLQGAPCEPRKAGLICAAEDGHRTEALLAERLRLVPGVRLWTEGEGKKQFGFSDFDGRFKGHIDGVIVGLIQAPKTPHLWENKAVNEKKFGEFRSALHKFGEKQTLQNFSYQWYVQAQCYMGYFDLTRHYLTVASAGGRDVLSCRTEFVPAVFDALRNKARRVLEAKEPPKRVMDNPSYYLCKWCPFREHCYA